MLVPDHLKEINDCLKKLFDDGHADNKLLEEAATKFLAKYEKLVNLFLVPREKSEVRDQISESGTRNEKRDTEP